LKCSAKKYKKIKKLLNEGEKDVLIDTNVTPQKESPSKSTEQSDGTTTKENYQTELDTYKNYLLIVLEILNSILTHKLVQNNALIYSLTYHQDIFDLYEPDPSLSKLVIRLNKIVSYFNDNIIEEKKKKEDWTHNDVVEVITNASVYWRNDKEEELTNLHFNYEENEPSDFFTPYIWHIVLENKDCHWQNTEIQPLLAGDHQDKDIDTTSHI